MPANVEKREEPEDEEKQPEEDGEEDEEDENEDEEEEEEIHAVEDFEGGGLGHVINVQIGSGGSQDFFFR